MRNAIKLSDIDTKNKNHPILTFEKRVVLIYITNVLFDGLNCLTHLIHIKPYGIFIDICFIHTHIFTKLSCMDMNFIAIFYLVAIKVSRCGKMMIRFDFIATRFDKIDGHKYVAVII